MGKVVETIAFAAVEIAVAVLAPEFLPATWSLLAVSAATAAIEIGVALAANALIGPTTPKGLATQLNNQQQRLFVSMDTTTPRKIVFGDTAGATDLRYQTYSDKDTSDQGYYHQIIAVASHQVNSIYEIWLDNEKAWTSAGGVQGRYAGFLTVSAINLGTSSNGIAVDSVWTTSCTLTGCAYIYLKYDLLGNATDGTNNSPFASGVSSRMTVRTQGALVYDPRLDSTVAGGSGSQRAATQSTWAWSSSASANPALQLLWYLLGWDINGKLAVGMGMPAARIDLASFAVAANACDESITLNGGGTEPRYRAAGVITEADDRQSVIESLCASMNAVLRDAGGKLSLTVLHNDLSTPVASFTESDILGEEKWQQTPDLSSTFNICRGRRVDPSDTSLYQLVDVTEAKLTSNDGIDRIDTADMPLVQSNGQAQRLLKQRLQRNQYQGRYTLTGKSRWWQTSLGDVVQLSHQGLGWANKLFRVAGQSISRTGETKMTLLEENAAIYAWDNSEAAAVTPGAPTIYNPANSPVLGKANYATKTAIVINGASAIQINADTNGTVTTALPKTSQYTASAGAVDFTTNASGSWSVNTVTGITTSIGAHTGLLSISAMAGSSAVLTITFVYGGVTRNYQVTVTKVNAPPTNSGGSGATGGTQGSTTTLGSAGSTTYDTTSGNTTQKSAVISATAGSGGQVQCVAPITFTTTLGISAHSCGTSGKWQWSAHGANTWADIAAEVGDTYDAQSDGVSEIDSGLISVTQTKTGLTNGTVYDFRFLWRRSSGSGSALYESGTMTATGS
jgi:hypothetical protein